MLVSRDLSAPPGHTRFTCHPEPLILPKSGQHHWGDDSPKSPLLPQRDHPRWTLFLITPKLLEIPPLHPDGNTPSGFRSGWQGHQVPPGGADKSRHTEYRMRRLLIKTRTVIPNKPRAKNGVWCQIFIRGARWGISLFWGITNKMNSLSLVANLSAVQDFGRRAEWVSGGISVWLGNSFL